MPQADSAKTYFGALCAAKIEDAGKTVREVAKKVPKTPATQFTRWKKGLWTYIPPDKLGAVVRAISDDPREQADLIIAYITDMTPIYYRPMIVVGQKGEGETPAAKPMGGVGSAWSEEMRARLDAVATAYKLDDDFAAMVDHLTQWAKRITKER